MVDVQPTRDIFSHETMEAQNKNSFKLATLSLVQMQKQAERTVEAAYLRGKEEAYNEIMKYLVMHNSTSDFRYVPIQELITYFESRYKAHREECEARNQALF